MLKSFSKFATRSASAMLAASLLSGFASAQVQTVSGTLSVAELSAGQSTTLTVSSVSYTHLTLPTILLV